MSNVFCAIIHKLTRSQTEEMGLFQPVLVKSLSLYTRSLVATVGLEHSFNTLSRRKRLDSCFNANGLPQQVLHWLHKRFTSPCASRRRYKSTPDIFQLAFSEESTREDVKRFMFFSVPGFTWWTSHHNRQHRVSNNRA
jgi:hypothetical protein